MKLMNLILVHQKPHTSHLWRKTNILLSELNKKNTEFTNTIKTVAGKGGKKANLTLEEEGLAMRKNGRLNM